MSREPAAEQLNKFKCSKMKLVDPEGKLTAGSGCPVGDGLNSLSAGPRGPLLLQDFQLIDELSHFDRERIPERVVHAKGGGAFGTLEITHDISHLCKASIFNKIGKTTPLAIRFSTVGGENGSADTVRDPRGFAVKFYTEEGNWDLVGNNTPVFFIRDPILFPSFIHTQKRNPVTHLKDSDMFWDFISLRPETTHQVMILFSERGIPDGFRFMNGYGSHTFKLVNNFGKAVYCKFHLKSDQGIRNLSPEKADELAGKDPDYSIRDLYNAIEKGEHPSWSFYIQVMTYKEAEEHKYNPFDLTKVWSHKEFPLIPVGKVTLNRNPKNYFAEIEQIAFAPSHMVPGIEASPDKMLQGRLFSYNDTHRHRLGANYLQLPVNCPYKTRVSNSQRDGPMTYTNQNGAPNYFPNSFGGAAPDEKHKEAREKVTGDIDRWSSDDQDNFSQPGQFYREVLSPQEQDNLARNLAGAMVGTQDFLRKRAIANFAKVDPRLGSGIQRHLDELISESGLKSNL